MLFSRTTQVHREGMISNEQRNICAAEKQWNTLQFYLSDWPVFDYWDTSGKYPIPVFYQPKRIKRSLKVLSGLAPIPDNMPVFEGSVNDAIKKLLEIAGYPVSTTTP